MLVQAKNTPIQNPSKYPRVFFCFVSLTSTTYSLKNRQVSDALVKAGEAPPLTGFSYSVPTGNFGDVLAGYYAKRMGLPVDRLVVATNENDILHR